MMGSSLCLTLIHSYLESRADLIPSPDALFASDPVETQKLKAVPFRPTKIVAVFVDFEDTPTLNPPQYVAICKVDQV